MFVSPKPTAGCSTNGEVLFDRSKPTAGCSTNGEVLFDRPKPTAGCSANGEVLFDSPKLTAGCSTNGEVLFDSPKPTAGCSANGRRSVIFTLFFQILCFSNSIIGKASQWIEQIFFVRFPFSSSDTMHQIRTLRPPPSDLDMFSVLKLRYDAPDTNATPAAV